MVALLKQKAKIVIQRKDRTKYAVADVFKQRKLDESNLAQSQVQPQGSSLIEKDKKEAKKITPKVIEKLDADM